MEFLLTKEQVLQLIKEKLGFNRTKAFYYIEADPTFPQGEILEGMKKPRWKQEEVLNWINTKLKEEE